MGYVTTCLTPKDTTQSMVVLVVGGEVEGMEEDEEQEWIALTWKNIQL